jgi:hypothetical protein
LVELERQARVKPRFVRRYLLNGREQGFLFFVRYIIDRGQHGVETVVQQAYRLDAERAHVVGDVLAQRDDFVDGQPGFKPADLLRRYLFVNGLKFD